MAAAEKTKVFRLRNLPGHLDRLAAIELLSKSLGDVALDDIQIGSLAFSLDNWTHRPTKTATLVFKKTPAIIASDLNGTEWHVPVPALEDVLILDHDFRGWTALNDVDPGQHQNKYAT